MDRSEIDSLLLLELPELIARADRVRREESLGAVDLCSIMNAKSGMCAEDCKFCAQSAHHSTGSSAYPLRDKKDMIEAAVRAKAIGAHRFDIVTSGNALTKEEIDKIARAISEISETVGIKICASLGKLDEKSLRLLKENGLSRYHHNIETSPRYFPKIVTTHSFQERVDTVKAAKRAGLEVCSGGIIGMGETWADRIDMALLLKDLDVDSVPINILVPIKATPFESMAMLTPEDAIRTIAIFRIILGNKTIKVAAGRESVLKDLQAMAFMAGANGMLIGGYLTIKGSGVDADRRLVKEIEKAWAK